MAHGVRVQRSDSYCAETVAAGRNYRIRRLDVAPGGGLAAALHRHRTEQFVVLSGRARIVRGEATLIAGENASVFIPAGMPHRLENPGFAPLSLLEVQFGSRFEEDDGKAFGKWP